MKTENAINVVNVGIGFIQVLKEVYSNTVNELTNSKSKVIDSFNSFREKGERDVRDPYLSIKVNAAWTLVYIKDAREKLVDYFIKKKEN